MENQKYYTNERNIQIIISVLKANGIRKIVASPGTTNYTFVASVQQDSFFEIYSSVDERSAAYLACGLAAETGEAVVLTCTGATASRNYYSGLTEAFYRKLPILALTAHQGNDRIGHLIPQNIDRRALPNDIVKLSVEAPTITCAKDERYVEVEVNKAVLELKRHGGGPVHINAYTTYSRDFSVVELPACRIMRRYTVFDAMPAIPQGRTGVFVGSHRKFTQKESQALDAFCATYDAAVFCDHTSGYHGRYRVDMSFAFVQNELDKNFAELDLLIHIGEVSGEYSFIAKATEVWRVNPDGEIRDTFQKLTNVFEMEEFCFFEYYSEENADLHTYVDALHAIDSKARESIPELPFGNIWVAQQMSSMLPQNSVLHLGILNSLRSWNFFQIPEHVEGYCNVGGFGIDGIVSSLVGASLACKEKLYFGVVGDLAFFYDLNVLGNRHLGNNIRILLINNGCGTEFRNYTHPCSAFGNDANAYMAAAGHYGNKSPLVVKNFVESLGFDYLKASTKEEFMQVVSQFVNPELSKNPIILEVFTNPEDESNALYMLNNSVQDKSLVMKKKIGNFIYNVFGQKGVSVVKKLLRK